MKHRTIRFFNMIELAIAIGIFAVAIMTILTLIPAGLEQESKAVGENYSSMAADSMTSSLSNKWSVVTDDDIIPTVKPVILANQMLDPSAWGDAEQGFIYNLIGKKDNQNNTLDAGVYGVKVTTGDITDFTGQVLIWKSNIENLYYGTDKCLISKYDAVIVRMEISWPAEIPYSERNLNNYYFELYNQGTGLVGGVGDDEDADKGHGNNNNGNDKDNPGKKEDKPKKTKKTKK
jgi:hypothetical protein